MQCLVLYAIHLHIQLIPIGLLIFIIILSINWHYHINEYNQLNKAKFEVINYIENYLPVKGYTKEWELLKKEKYKGLTKMDENISKGIIIICILLIITLIFMKINILTLIINYMIL